MFVCIQKNPDGSHAFQYGGIMQEGWAYWDMDTVPIPSTFPYVDIEVEEVLHPATSFVHGYSQMEVVSASEREVVEEDIGIISDSERITTLEDALAQTDEIAIELYEAQAAQEEINAAQDEALIELYELIGG